MFDDEDHGIRIRFSRIELQHLAVAVVFLTLAFTFVLRGIDSISPQGILQRLLAPWKLYVSSLIAVSSGFVLHELGHKVIAQRFGHWAEFRGEFKGLLISMAFALGLGFLFAAPGAVMISGRVTSKENGIISLFGPLINLVIALLAIPFTFSPDTTRFVPYTMSIVALINGGLAVFNMLPIFNLDGRKIWAWNPFVYLATMGFSIGLVIVMTVFLGLHTVI